MKIGTTKELKNHEYRVGLTPDNVSAFVAKGHTVLVETRAGIGAGFPDQDYINAGAQIVATPAEVFAQCDMVVKVKEPEECEYKYLRKDLILFTYLHLAPNPKLAKALMDSGCKAVAFETITDAQGKLLQVVEENLLNNEATLTYNVSDLAQGIYFIYVRNNGHTIAKKFVVTRE